MKTSKDPFKQHINASNAKKAAVFLVLGFIVYHGMLHVSYRIDSCKWLLSDGRFQGYHVWQPYGCMLHNYSRTDTRICMQYIAYWGGHNTFVFMGDSRIRQIFRAFAKHVSSRSESAVRADESDLKYEEKDLKVDLRFLWRPLLNSSVSVSYQSWLDEPPNQRPKMIVTGCATWSIRENNASVKSLEDYKTNLTRLISSIDSLGASGSRVLWVLQDPVKPEKLSPDLSMITNEQIDLYNKAAIDALRYASSSGVHIWGSSRLLSQGYGRNDDEDGLHMGSQALEYAVQILLNMYCNDQMNFNDGSCCSDPEAVTGLQIFTFAFFFFICLVSSFLVIHHKMSLRKYQNFTLLVNQEDDSLSSSNSINLDDFNPQDVSEDNLLVSQDSPPSSPKVSRKETKSYYELITCLARIGLIMAYAFLCDRTNFFMKENKYYTAPNFFLPIAYVFALGLFFTEDSKLTRVMHRDQTNEWKGWMQLVILTYYMTGADQVLPIYVNVRLLITSYLFLMGFNHFTHYWQRGDTGLFRMWQVRVFLLTNTQMIV